MSNKYTSSKLQEMENLHKEFEKNFGGKYNYSTQRENSIIETIRNSKHRLIIFSSVIFIFVGYILYKIRPRYIIYKDEYNDERIKLTSFLFYTLLITLLLAGIISFIIYKYYPRLKSIIFNDCELCIK